MRTSFYCFYVLSSFPIPVLAQLLQQLLKAGVNLKKCFHYDNKQYRLDEPADQFHVLHHWVIIHY